MIKVFRSVFHEGNKYYLQVFLAECFYENDSIDVPEGIDFKKTTGCMRVLFVINRTFFRKICYLERLRPKICVGCQDVLQKAVSFNDMAIASVK